MKRAIFILLLLTGCLPLWRADAYNQYPDENQEYFHPVDKFPDNKTGIKIIGYFRAADSDSKGITSDLTPDRTRGEKDNGRIFELNIHVPAGSTYKFTEENPLIVIMMILKIVY